MAEQSCSDTREPETQLSIVSDALHDICVSRGRACSSLIVTVPVSVLTINHRFMRLSIEEMAERSFPQCGNGF